jgi:Icc-related predicted phosphoesterase
LKDPYEYNEDEIFSFFRGSKSSNPQNSIWAVHCPPFGYPQNIAKVAEIAGVSVGSKGLLQAIEEASPFLVLSGHIHGEGSWKVGKTHCFSAPAMSDNRFLQLELENDQVTMRRSIHL